jgi:HSP20 family protein
MAKTQETKVNNQENTQAMQTTDEQSNAGASTQQTSEQTGLARRDSSSASFFGGSPFAVMRRFREEMDRLFEDFGFGGRSLMPNFGRDLFSRTLGDFGSEAVWSPQVEMFERGGKLIVRADLPGMKKDDVKVEVTNDAVTISGERRSEHEEKREGFYRSERSYGSFFRRIPLPEGVNTEDAEATFNNGVLEIEMKAPEKRSTGRRLEIKDSNENAK